MKVPAILNTQAGQLLVVVVVGAGLAYFLYKKLPALPNGDSLAEGGSDIWYNILNHGPIGAIRTALGFESVDDYEGAYAGSSDAPSAATRSQVVTPNYVTDLSQTTPIGGATAGSW